jgi:hypothetical protein
MKKFTLRDLFFVTPLVAMACGWWVDHWRSESRNRELNAARRELGQAMEAHGFLLNVDVKTGKQAHAEPWACHPCHPVF